MSTWWIDKPLVMGSSNPSDETLARLRAEDFARLVCLLDENEQRPRYDPDAARRAGWSLHSLPIRDYTAPSIDQITMFVGLVDGAGDGARVLVHCEGGTGRTGTMAAAYWIARGLSARDAIARVRRARPGAIETDEQRDVLHEFATLRHARRHEPR
jgi:protein-tyrosine phosphatase